MDDINPQMAAGLGAMSMISLFGVNLARAALRRMPFAARHPQTPNQPTGCDSSDAGSDLQYYSAQDKENQNCQDTPGSITSPKNVDRSPLQGRTLKPLLEKAMLDTSKTTSSAASNPDKQSGRGHRTRSCGIDLATASPPEGAIPTTDTVLSPGNTIPLATRVTRRKAAQVAAAAVKKTLQPGCRVAQRRSGGTSSSEDKMAIDLADVIDAKGQESTQDKQDKVGLHLQGRRTRSAAAATCTSSPPASSPASTSANNGKSLREQVVSAVAATSAGDLPCKEGVEARGKRPRCILLDRDLAGLSPTRHVKLLKGNPTVTVRTVKNVLSGRLLTPASDNLEQLLSQYVTSLHTSAPGPALHQHLPSSSSATSSAEAGAQGKKRSALTQDTPVKGPKRSGNSKANPTANKTKASSAAAQAEGDQSELKEGEILELDRHKFKVGKEAARGAMSSLRFATCLTGEHAGKAVMLKIQPRARKTIYQITTEHHVLTKLKHFNKPQLLTQEVLAYGCHKGQSYILATTLLGDDLLKLAGPSGQLSPRNLLLVAHQGVTLLEQLHACNVLHRDVKPENMVAGAQGSTTARMLHLIDFGTSESLVDRNGARRMAAQAAEGSVPYMAVSVHQKTPLGKRDDVEGLVWTVMRLALGILPWEDRKGGCLSHAAIVAQKTRFKAQGLRGGRGLKDSKETDKNKEFKDLSPAVAECLEGMLSHVQTLQEPGDEPDYQLLRSRVEQAWRRSPFSREDLARAQLQL